MIIEFEDLNGIKVVIPINCIILTNAEDEVDNVVKHRFYVRNMYDHRMLWQVSFEEYEQIKDRLARIK